ncbi:MAG: hypothetical protein ABFD97_20155 [Syntrophobacter sp.]
MKYLIFKRFSRVRAGILFCAVSALLLVSLSGCASTRQGPSSKGPTQREVETTGRQELENSWWYARFQFNWPQDQEPSWHLDLMVANTIIAPVLEKHGAEIPLWRVHRRAAPDQSGHQFSFIFFATQKSAGGIFETIKSNPMLAQMRSAGLITATTFDDTVKVIRPGIGGVSDGHWSVPVRRSWPFFIMGVSEMWMGLIDQLAEDGRPRPKTALELEAFYRKINEEVLAMWNKEAGHALLHHLNAVFGYEPLTFRGQEYKF